MTMDKWNRDIDDTDMSLEVRNKHSDPVAEILIMMTFWMYINKINLEIIPQCRKNMLLFCKIEKENTIFFQTMPMFLPSSWRMWNELQKLLV